MLCWCLQYSCTTVVFSSFIPDIPVLYLAFAQGLTTKILMMYPIYSALFQTSPRQLLMVVCPTSMLIACIRFSAKKIPSGPLDSYVAASTGVMYRDYDGIKKWRPYRRRSAPFSKNLSTLHPSIVRASYIAADVQHMVQACTSYISSCSR